jgi:putative PEP-CTERM system histidine kinase
VTGTSFVAAAYLSYGIAAVAYALFAVRVIVGWRPNLRAGLLAGALIASAAWATGALIGVGTRAPAAAVLLNIGDLTRYAMWFAFTAALMRNPSAPFVLDPARRRRWLRRAAVFVAGAVVLAGALILADASEAFRAVDGARIALALHLALPIVGLAMVEQLMRRAHTEARWSLRPLAVTLIGIYGYDLFVYADAMLFNQMDVDLWIARGAAHALVIPFLAVATARNSGWTVDMHVSRGAVFHSTALIACGAFLLAVAGAGYLVRILGDWGRAFQIELLFGAVLCVVFVATSGRFRSRLRVFVSKHFFSYRYDYREEWLRFTRTLAHEDVQRLPERTIMALANLVESPGGALWLEDERNAYVPAGRYNMSQPAVKEASDGSLAGFLRRTGWVVDLQQYRSNPAHYGDLVLPEWVNAMPSAWVVAPLATGNDLIGFVVLTTPRVVVDLNWEVLDVIKTASRQAASYIAHSRATEALLEARKFDAFNRMSAFVVHDLKNLIAQLSLMIRNAERHSSNPDFQRDMLVTVRHVVERMNGLMLQLRTGATPVEKPHAVDLVALARRVCSAKSQGGRRIDVDIRAAAATSGHEDRLEHVLGHLVQNALDASAKEEPVLVTLQRSDGFAVLEVADRGPGMSPEFIRDRLGKPFETTKSAGMGIGVYESNQYVTSIGGQLIVDSIEGTGTQVRLLLRLAEHEARSASGHPQSA